MNSPIELALRLTPHAATPVATAAEEERALFTEIVREHGSALLALAGRLTACRSDAEDLLQETLLRAWRGLTGFRGDASVRTWLFRILLNVWRSGKPRLVVETLSAEPTGDSIPGPARDTVQREFVEQVLAAVDRLPRRQKETLLLRVRGGLSYEEIAAVMRIKKGAVKSHLVHARRKLLRRFGNEIREWGIEP